MHLITNISISPIVSEHAGLKKLSLSEGGPGQVSSHVISLDKAFLIYFPGAAKERGSQDQVRTLVPERTCPQN